MDPNDNPLYNGREQSLIKHIILENYLFRFAIIVGQKWDQVTYVDCFSGPWNVQSEELEDASFAIALKQLRAARKAISDNWNRHVTIRCLFLEKDKDAFFRLSKYCIDQSSGNDAEIEALNESFEAAIPQVIEFISSGEKKSFPFLFIDPTGWTGFAMPVIQPLLRLNPSEVLINFMTSFVLRFIKTENLTLGQGFEKLFGDPAYKTRFADLTGRELEDALVFEYAAKVAQAGQYDHYAITIVPHPEKDRTHFHLIYLTRHLRGIEVFKEAERKAIKGLGQIRTNAKLRRVESTTGISDMFSGSSFPETDYVIELKARYAMRAKVAINAQLKGRNVVGYDELYALAMRYPMVQVNDLRAMLQELGTLVEGLSLKERFPKCGRAHRIRLKKN